MKVHTKIPALGLLLLSGAIVFPQFSNAMELGINLDNKINLEHRDDTYWSKDEMKTNLDSKVNIEKSDDDNKYDGDKEVDGGVLVLYCHSSGG